MRDIQYSDKYHITKKIELFFIKELSEPSENGERKIIDTIGPYDTLQKALIAMQIILSNDSLKEGETMGTIQYFDIFNSYADTSQKILKNAEEGKYD